MNEAADSSKASFLKATAGRTSNLSIHDQVALIMKLKTLRFLSLKYTQIERRRLTHFRMHFCPTVGGTGQSLHTEEDII